MLICTICLFSHQEVDIFPDDDLGYMPVVSFKPTKQASEGHVNGAVM